MFAKVPLSWMTRGVSQVGNGCGDRKVGHAEAGALPVAVNASNFPKLGHMTLLPEETSSRPTGRAC